MKDESWALPRGPHRLPREVVAGNQRQRLLAGAATALAENGYAGTTVERVLANAGVSRSTFYAHFENRRDCVLAAHDRVFERLSGTLVAACAGEPDWPAKVAAAIRAAIEFARRSPVEAHLLLLDAVAADSVLATRVLTSNDFLVALLRNGREQWAGAAVLPELTERALVGAAMSVIGGKLIMGQTDQLDDLEPQLIQFFLAPYVGLTEARRLTESD